MKKGILGIFICGLLLGSVLIPVTVGAINELPPSDSASLQMKALVKGVFPRVSDNNITYITFPGLKQVTIPKDEFSGHIGFFIILGVLEPTS